MTALLYGKDEVERLNFPMQKHVICLCFSVFPFSNRYKEIEARKRNKKTLSTNKVQQIECLIYNRQLIIGNHK